MIVQSELSGERLAAEVATLLASPDTITKMEAAAKELGREDAAEKTADIIEELKASV
jgi:UDP-N-acetylglucosamine--N-acetylmuramyl-(pentapeptide) pyrophosphoryl-undecaprenol N-acetylglucosamine transferase